MIIDAVGGSANDPAWVKQKGQCSKWIMPLAGSSGALSSTTLIILAPTTVQISTQDPDDPWAAATAWEIDGESADSRIAKEAIQATIRRVD